MSPSLVRMKPEPLLDMDMGPWPAVEAAAAPNQLHDGVLAGCGAVAAPPPHVMLTTAGIAFSAASAMKLGPRAGVWANAAAP